MQTLGIYFFVDVAISYVAFGLAIHAIAGLIALMWVGRNFGDSRRVRRDLYLAYGSISGLVLLDACRQVWDSIRPDHFPLAVTRIALPLLYLMLGHTLVSIARLMYRKDVGPEKDAKETKAASPSAGI